MLQAWLPGRKPSRNESAIFRPILAAFAAESKRWAPDPVRDQIRGCACLQQALRGPWRTRRLPSLQGSKGCTLALKISRRHDCGDHFYWDKLVRDGGKIDSCRAIFGDESENYEGALKRHNASGAPLTWQQEFVTAYATSHPWEDFAEITSTLSIHWRPRALLDSARGLRFPRVMCFALKSSSIRIVVGTSIKS